MDLNTYIFSKWKLEFATSQVVKGFSEVKWLYSFFILTNEKILCLKTALLFFNGFLTSMEYANTTLSEIQPMRFRQKCLDWQQTSIVYKVWIEEGGGFII